MEVMSASGSMTRAGRVHRVITITSEREWDTLEEDWNALLQRSANSSVFLTWEWLRAWWRSYSRYVRSRRLHLLVAVSDRGVAGIAPLYWTTAPGYGLGELRVLRFIGDGSDDSEYLDFIIEAGHEAVVLGAFFDHLARQGWDVLELDLLRENSPNIRVLRDIIDRQGYVVSSEDFPCTSLTLPDTWEDYLAGLQSRFRTKLRSLLRRLPEEHGAVFSRCEDPAELGDRLESMFAMHQARWVSVGQPGSFALEERRAFYHDVADRFLRRGWLRFYSLQIHGRPAAYEFSFEYGGRVYYLQQAYDIEFAQLSVGNALKAYVLKECIEEGVQAYDFLGDAAEHKLRWGATVEGCTRLRIARSGLRTSWGLWLPDLFGRVRAWSRSIAPEPVLDFKRYLQKRLVMRRSS